MRLPSFEKIQETQSNLSLKIARDPEHIAQCQRLRYKVYCVERGWYNEVQISKGRELDRYDERAEHALLSRSDNGDSVGVVRLVLPSGDPMDPDLPIQEIEPSPLRFADEPLDALRLAEVSRFSVTKDYNRRALNEDGVSSDRRIHGGLPMLSINLLHGVIKMAQDNNIEYLCATMEPALLLLLARLGFVAKPLGKARVYHGLRQPCYCRLSTVAEEMKSMRPEVYPLVFGDD